jgi:Tol biopolymer transport system component
VQPFWAPDSQRVLFLDKPIASLPAGLWGVGLDGGVPELVSEKLGIFSSTMNYRAFLENGVTLVERLADGQQWQIANEGRLVYFSPDDEQLAWTIPSSISGLREVWVSQVDGSQAQRLYASAGASFVAWLADGRILIQEQAQDGSGDQVLSVLSLSEDLGEVGQSQPLAQGFRLRNPLASPDGRWIAYFATFDEDPEANGLWLVDTNSGQKQRLSLFGAYRWRDAQRLLVIPLDLQEPFHQLWQVGAETGVAIPLTDSTLTPFKVGGGDWQVSPDGQWMIFVSAGDSNIWLMKLP